MWRCFLWHLLNHFFTILLITFFPHPEKWNSTILMFESILVWIKNNFVWLKNFKSALKKFPHFFRLKSNINFVIFFFKITNLLDTFFRKKFGATQCRLANKSSYSLQENVAEVLWKQRETSEVKAIEVRLAWILFFVYISYISTMFLASHWDFLCQTNFLNFYSVWRNANICNAKKSFGLSYVLQVLTHHKSHTFALDLSDEGN